MCLNKQADGFRLSFLSCFQPFTTTTSHFSFYLTSWKLFPFVELKLIFLSINLVNYWSFSLSLLHNEIKANKASFSVCGEAAAKSTENMMSSTTTVECAKKYEKRRSRKSLLNKSSQFHAMLRSWSETHHGYTSSRSLLSVDIQNSRQQKPRELLPTWKFIFHFTPLRVCTIKNPRDLYMYYRS